MTDNDEQSEQQRPQPQPAEQESRHTPEKKSGWPLSGIPKNYDPVKKSED